MGPWRVRVWLVVLGAVAIAAGALVLADVWTSQRFKNDAFATVAIAGGLAMIVVGLMFRESTKQGP